MTDESGARIFARYESKELYGIEGEVVREGIATKPGILEEHVYKGDPYYGAELASIYSPHPGTAVEFCPLQGLQHLFVCATYERPVQAAASGAYFETASAAATSAQGTIHPHHPFYYHGDAGAERTGSLVMFEISRAHKHKGEEHKQKDELSIRPLQTLQPHALPGMLDVRWSPYSMLADPSNTEPIGIAAAAGSNGAIYFFGEQKEEKGFVRRWLRQMFHVVRPAGGPYACLGLDWNTRVIFDPAARLAAAYEDGFSAVWQWGESSVELLQNWKSTRTEVSARRTAATCVGFDYHMPTVLMSGGSDGRLRAFDIRDKLTEATAPLFDVRAGDMGPLTTATHHVEPELVGSGGASVSSVAMNLARPFYFVVGDGWGEIGIWDIREMRDAPMKYLDLSPGEARGSGGAAWRLRWHPENDDWLLVDCTRGGWTIVDTKLEAGEKIERVAKYRGRHTGAMYGADWIEADSDLLGKEGTLCAGCSFEDKLCSLWHPVKRRAV